MRIALICCVITLAVLGTPLAAQSQPPQESSYQALSDKFFEFLQQDKTADAVESLYSTNPRLKRMTQQAEQLTAELNRVRTQAGPYVSHAMLVETTVGGMYVYQHYFVAYEREPVSVRISYYNRGGVWVCQRLQVDTHVEELIDKTADSYMRLDVK